MSRIWRAFGLQPHRQDSWKLSKDPLFVDKVKDVVGLYLNRAGAGGGAVPWTRSLSQAFGPRRADLPNDARHPGPRQPRLQAGRHLRLYAALDIASGQVIGTLHARHRAIEFKKFLAAIDDEVPADLDVHLVLDNVSTHKTPAIKRWLVAHPRFYLHFTPTSASWLNLVERWFGELTSKKLRRGTHRSVRELEADIRGWIATWNDNPRPYVWTKTADQILASIARYCTRINDSGH